jgi:hypothetical protein
LEEVDIRVVDDLCLKFGSDEDDHSLRCRPPWSLPNSSSPSGSSTYGSGSGRKPLLYDLDNGWILDAGLG